MHATFHDKVQVCQLCAIFGRSASAETLPPITLTTYISEPFHIQICIGITSRIYYFVGHFRDEWLQGYQLMIAVPCSCPVRDDILHHR